ncbi:MAG: cell division protein ZipA [Gammaproteobacteria bacterium]|nr:cell division protein ZipA [Gammaproteobacteria bacterium]
MKVRLILFIIALIVIAWIVWDHKRKNIKSNKYVNKSYQNHFLSFINNFFSNLLRNKNKSFNKNTKKSLGNPEFSDRQFESDYKRAKEYDEFELILHDKNEYAEYKNKVYPAHAHTQKTKVAQDTSMFLVTLNIKATENRRFSGDELLQALISVGCRFGEMSIFHRHEKTSGHGAIMFSIASMIKPGIFDIDHMHEFSTPGITMFFRAPCEFNAIVVYDLMLKTGYKLAKLLNAEILDDERELLSNAKIAETKAILENYVVMSEEH